MLYELKIDLKYYTALSDGKKTFEIRYNDRDYKVGDIIRLCVYDRIKQVYLTDYDSLLYEITYVLDDYGLLPNYVCLGMKKLNTFIFD